MAEPERLVHYGHETWKEEDGMSKTMIAEHGTPDLLKGTRESRRVLRGLGSRLEDHNKHIAIGAYPDEDRCWVAYVHIAAKDAYSCGYFETRAEALQDAREAAEDMGLLP